MQWRQTKHTDTYHKTAATVVYHLHINKHVPLLSTNAAQHKLNHHTMIQLLKTSYKNKCIIQHIRIQKIQSLFLLMSTKNILQLFIYTVQPATYLEIKSNCTKNIRKKFNSFLLIFSNKWPLLVLRNSNMSKHY